MTIEFTAPVRIESELNRRDHWAARKRRQDAQRDLTYWHYRDAIPPGGTLFVAKWWKGKPHFTVTLTRIAPRPITDEHDNLRSGWKKVVDLLAELLECDDGNTERVTWAYKQERGKPKEYAVRIRIEAAS